MKSGLKIALVFAFFFGASFGHSDVVSPQPIGFFCSPYLRSFESGKHYLPSGGTCTYEAPTLQSPAAKTLHIYKGTPGNATRLATHQFVAATHTQTADNFSSLSDGDDLFVAIYQTSAFPATNQAFDSYFLTGESSPPNDNYGILQFKYGAKPSSEYDPVIIIPGILGSWEKNETWKIDPIFHIYDDLIKTFKENGYVENQNLFTFPYNWRLSNEENATNLKNKIAEIKNTCGCGYIDIVAHSMGGLIARSYAQGSNYQNDIDQLIFLGTPHLGAPKSYKIWEGAEFSQGVVDFFGFALKRIFSNEARRNGYSDVFDYIRNKPISSVQQLLPTFDYLINVPGGTRDYPTNYPQNTFLENLSANANNLTVNKIRYKNVIGSAGGTILGFQVGNADGEAPKWEHGKVVMNIEGAGDGTVPRTSIEDLFGAADKQVETDHTSLPSNIEVQKFVFKTLNDKEPETVVDESYLPNAKILFIEIFFHGDVLFTNEDGNSAGTDPDTGEEVGEIDGAFYSGSDDPEYLVITDPGEGDYTIEVLGTGDGGEYTITASYITDDGSVDTEYSGNIEAGETETIILSLEDDSLELATESATYSGSIFEDADGNGVRAEAAVPEDCAGGDFCAPEETEAGLADRTVTASPIDEGGNADESRTEKTATTTDGGNFEFTFTSGEFGWWRVGEDVPDGFSETAPAAGHFDVNVQNGDAESEDDDGNPILFGNWRRATTTAFVWDDADEDGSYDDGEESPLSGFAVALALITETADSLSATLSAAGVTDQYGFVSLAQEAPGLYVLLVEDRDDFDVTTPKATTTTLSLAKGAGAMSTNFLLTSYFRLATSTSGESVTKDNDNGESDTLLYFGVKKAPAANSSSPSFSPSSTPAGNGIPGSVGGGGISFVAPAASAAPAPAPTTPPPASPAPPASTPASAGGLLIQEAPSAPVAKTAAPVQPQSVREPQVQPAPENSPAVEEESAPLEQSAAANNQLAQAASAANALNITPWEWLVMTSLLLSLGGVSYLLFARKI